MIRSIIGGAAAAALLACPALSAPPRDSGARDSGPRDSGVGPPKGRVWVITPTETGCRVDLDLHAPSGTVTPVTLTSDGQLVSLRFAKPDLPARAFLPIRVDGKAYANLMLRGEAGAGELVLSAETEAALRRGSSLGIAWLSDQPLVSALGRASQGLSDLRTCGAQTASRHSQRVAAEQAARERAASEDRARALADAQLAVVRAQAAAAEAQRRSVEEAAERQRLADAEAADQRRRQAARDAEAEEIRAADRERLRRQALDDDEPRWAPPPRWTPAPRYPYPYD